MADSSISQKRCSKKSECLHPESDDGWLPASTDYFMLHKGKLYCQCHYCRKKAKTESHARNREHNNERTARWHIAHPEYGAQEWVQRKADPVRLERDRQRSREYYRKPENTQRIKDYQRALYWSDPEKARAGKRKYHRSHPEIARINSKLAKHRRRTAEGWYTADDIHRMIRQQKGKCWWCGKKYGDNYHLDHVIPIARGGTNDPSNLCLACANCNLSKHAKLPHEWNGRMF